MTFVLAYPVKYPWQVITYAFLHGYTKEVAPPDFPYSLVQLTIGHLVYNLLLVIPFGILIEKVVKSKRFLLLSVAAWLMNLSFSLVLASIIAPEGTDAFAAGASGFAFSYMPVGVYIIFVLGKKYGFKQLFKQVSFYLLLPIAITTLIIALSPSVKGVTGIWSMMMHIIGVFVGVVFSVIYNKQIKEFYEKRSIVETK
jgi:membrane associated rhomboid family serine protease